VDQLGHLGKQFMAVVDQGNPPDSAKKVRGRQSIQIIGNQQIRFFDKHKFQPQTQVVICIKKRPLVEEQFEAMYPKREFFGFKTFRQAASDADYFHTFSGQ
jgi:hypothetical protein